MRLRVDAARVPALARGMARKSKKQLDLGWDLLRAELTRLPVPLPKLKSLALTTGKEGPNKGARHFPLEFFAPLRYQNPDASITMAAAKGSSSNIIVELQSGEQHTLDVTGAPSTEILRRVLETGGMPAHDVLATMDELTPAVEAIDGDDLEVIGDDVADEAPKVEAQATAT